MSIDFTLPPDVEEMRRRVREFMDEVVRPAEEKVYANAPDGEPDRSDIVRMIIELRKKAHEWNVWLPHMPEGVGRDRPRDHGDGIRVGRGGPHRLRPVHPERPGARRRQHAHAAASRQRRAEGEVPPAAPRGACALVLRDDRARGRRLRPDGHPDDGRPATATSGSSTATSGSSRGAKGATFAILIARPTPMPTRRRRRTPRSSSTSPPTDWEIVRDIDTMAGHGNHCEIRITDLRLPHSAVLGGRGKATCSGSRDSARRASRTACGGSARPRPRSRCS